MKKTSPTLVVENPEYETARNNLQVCMRGTIEETVSQIRRLLPSFKCGNGGSHVWVSSCDNERIAIIYFEDNEAK
jgi:hypothetical protein